MEAPGKPVPPSESPGLPPYREAVSLHAAGRLPEASTKAEEAVGLDPALWEAWQFLGNCRYQAGDAPGALEAWKRSTDLNPANEGLKEFAGRVRMEFQKAMRDMMDTAKLFDGMAEKASAQGEALASAAAHFEAGRLDEAEAVARRAIRDNQKNWQAWKIVGDCALARGDRRSALQSYNRAVEANPGAADIRELIKRLVSGAFGGSQ